MTATINASTSAGVVVTSDTSGSLALQTNSGVTALTIDTSQNVTCVGNITLNNGAADGAQLTLASSGYSNWNIDNYSGNLRAYYNATEYWRTDTSGNFLVGATTSWASRTVVQSGGAAMAYQSGVSNGNSSLFSNNFYQNSGDKCIATGYTQGIVMNNDGTGKILTLTTSGTTSAGGGISFTAGPYVSAGGTSWTNSSDERLKNITGEISNGLTKVCSLRAAEFTWKDDDSNKPCVGLIAQDVQAVLPEAISSNKKYNSEDETEYLGVQYTEVIPLLVAAIKEQQSLIQTLQTQVAQLQAKVGV